MNTTLPWHDPIVAEIHATREHLAEQYHDDLVAYSQAAETHCRALGFRMAEGPRLRPSTVDWGEVRTPTFRGGCVCVGVASVERQQAHPWAWPPFVTPTYLA